jgi:uncharacterized protein (DUF302 family)
MKQELEWRLAQGLDGSVIDPHHPGIDYDDLVLPLGCPPWQQQCPCVIQAGAETPLRPWRNGFRNLRADARGSAQMKKETVTNFQYGFETTLLSTNYDDVVRHVTDALKKEGFGILTEIDVSATLKKKLDVDFRRYTILGACNPNLAYRALKVEPQIGLLLPCNVAVQETTGRAVIVSIADPKAMFALVNNPTVASVAEEVDARLRRVIAVLAGKETL